MNNDLKIIKKKYGEKMMHFCRATFSTILETEGLLPQLLISKFNESHYLYDDIVKNDKLLEFRNFIYGLITKEEPKEIIADKTPEELMDEAGYVLKECKTETEVQEYAKYYTEDERLCTFRNMELYGFSRLSMNRVFFAVRKDVDKIKREDFTKPEREDEYGTSVLSIQFSKDETHIVSIISRYNHSVYNPNATYSNNLDEIIPGLTDSFAKYKNLEQKQPSDGFNLEGYVKAKDGKLYKFNYETVGTYYCPDNVVIEFNTPKKYDKSRYLVFDYFILDLNEKMFVNYSFNDDGFMTCISQIDKIVIKNEGNHKILTITGDNDKRMVIELNELNQIIKLSMENIRTIGDKFLYYNDTLEKFDASDLLSVGHHFLSSNTKIKTLELDNLLKTGNSFLENNKVLEKCSFKSLKIASGNFLPNNQTLTEIDLPSLEVAGPYFMNKNTTLKSIRMENARKIGDNFLSCNRELQSIYMPKVTYISSSFLPVCEKLREVILSEVKEMEEYFLSKNPDIEVFYAPKLETIGFYSLESVKKIGSMYTPSLRRVGINVLFSLEEIKEYDFSSLVEYSDTFMPLYENRDLIIGNVSGKNADCKVK